MPSEYYYTHVKMQNDVPLENAHRLHVLWR